MLVTKCKNQILYELLFTARMENKSRVKFHSGKLD